MSTLVKPVLRGHMKKRGLMAFAGAMGFCTINCTLLYSLYIVPKRERIDEFFKNFDSKAHTLQMIKWGYFQTIRPADLKKTSR